MRGYLFQRLHGNRKNMKKNDAIFLKSHDKYSTFIETKYLFIQKFLLNHPPSKLNVVNYLWKTGNSLWDKTRMLNIIIIGET